MSKQNFCQRGKFTEQQNNSLVTINKRYEEIKELFNLSLDGYIQDDDVSSAEGGSREAISAQFKPLENSPSDEACGLAQDAEKYFDEEDYQQAVEVMKQAIELDNNIEYQIRLGQYLFFNDKTIEAEQVFANLLEKTECSNTVCQNELQIIHLMYFTTLCGAEKYDEARVFCREYSILEFDLPENKDLQEILQMMGQDNEISDA